MGLRPGRCCRNIERSFTRIAPKVQRKNYLGGVPGVRTRDFAIGNQTKDYNSVLDVIAKESIQIRDNALEALRQKLVKKLTAEVGKEEYFIKIRLYPHHILREHKSASGAGADRVSKGMKLAYGKNTGRAVQIKKGQTLLSIVVDASNIAKVKKIIDTIRYKVNMAFEVKQGIHENKVLTGRKKWTREAKLQKLQEPVKEETKDVKGKAPAKGGKAAPAAKADAKAAPAAKGGKAAPAAKADAKAPAKKGKK
jgi:large subunit ribosomal protein L10e